MTEQRSRARRLMLLMLGAIALFGLAAAACTSGDDGGDGSGDPTATMDDGGGDDGDSLAGLAAFGGEYDSFTGKVTYNITNLTGEDGAGSITIYQKDGSSRFDMSGDLDPDQAGDVTFISTPEATYLCTEGQCLQYPAGDEFFGSAGVDLFASIFSADTITEDIGDIPAGVDVDVTSEKIAGIDATCFNYSGDLDADQPGDESGEFCFSDGGLLLRLAFEGADESGSFEATSASEDVPDSDFDPPFPVTDLGDLGDIFQP